MPSETFILFPPFRLDVLNEQLWRDNEVLPVRPKPFAVLAYLAAHAGRLVTASELRKAVWPDTYVGEGVLRGYIREVRIVLGDDSAAPRFIETVARRGYRFIGEVVSSQHSVTSSLPPLTQPSAFSPQPSVLVGRERELQHLHHWLDKAAGGERQVVFVTGEPGIGKTTLIDAFLLGVGGWGLGIGPSAQASNLKPEVSSSYAQHSVLSTQDLRSPTPNTQHLTPSLWLARGQCVEHYGVGEAYLPVLEALGQLCRQPGGEQVIALLSRYAPTWLVQLPALLPEAEFATLQRKVQGTTRERMLREMAETLEVLTVTQCAVVVLEDLQWSDHSTLELVSYMTQRREPARLLVIGTYRPADVIVSGHSIKALKQELQGKRLCEELAVGVLSQTAVQHYVDLRFPRHQFSDDFIRLFARSTEGNPLFIVNMADYVEGQGVVEASEGRWRVQVPLAEVAAGVPESVRQMIERQLERLSAAEQRLLEAASVVGVEFDGAAAAAGLGEAGADVERLCEALVRRGHFLQALGTETLPEGVVTGRYGFRHALYQNVLYERMPTTRRLRLHRSIGAYLEGAYGARVSEVAVELAMHFERGQDHERAVQYLTQAGQSALRRPAPREAIDLLTKGLELLRMLPDTPERLQQKLALQIRLGWSLAVTRGFAAPEVEHVYTQARELCQQIGETPLLFPALFGLFPFYLTRARYKTAHELAEQLMRLAQSAHDPILLLGSHLALGTSLLYLGEISAAEAHTREEIVLYKPQWHDSSLQLYGQDLGVVSRAQGSWALWLLGYPDQALQRAHEALTLAQQLSYPFGIAFASHYVAIMRQIRRESQAALKQAEFTRGFATEQGFPFWLALATMICGGELAEQGNGQEGIMQMRQGLDAYQALGANIGRTYWVGLLAEKSGKRGQAAEGLELLVEAFSLVEKSGERWWEAELYRLKGELLLNAKRGMQNDGRKTKRKRQSSSSIRRSAFR